MNIYELILPATIFITFAVIAGISAFRHFLLLCIPFGLSIFAIWKGYYGHFNTIYFVIPAFIAFISLLLLIYKAVQGDLI
jgi:hypothetical protein